MDRLLPALHNSPTDIFLVWRKRISVLISFALAFSSVLVARAAQIPVPRDLPEGLAWSFGETEVEARVASPHAFCLRIHASGASNEARSIYLAETPPPPAPFKTLQEGEAVRGITTDFGQLLVDAERQTWCLRDPSGKVLADWTALGKPTDAGTTASPATELTVGPAAPGSHPLFYGSGTMPDRGALTQKAGIGEVGNGTTSLPQYWSTAGYGALLVGVNDSAPASWKAGDGGAVVWKVPGGSFDLYLCPAPDLSAWLRADAELTGFAPVPPLWTFGYLQSRWGWKDKAYIDETLAHFRQGRFPVDAFIIDFEWYTPFPDYWVKRDGIKGFPDFRWNGSLFPEPRKQIDEMAEQGIHLFGIRKPRLADSDNLNFAREKGYLLKPVGPHADGSDYQARDVNFANPAAREWWADNNRHFLEDGMASFWNDEGELDFVEYSYWNLAERTVWRQVNPGKRFWSLNRSMAPGLQRFGAAVWTGDYNGTWEVLARQPGEMLSYGLAGMPYTSCDIGGMEPELKPELLTRWMQAAIFFPIMRAHSSAGVTPHFPWLYGAEAEDAMRKALELRYRLIPYYYSLAYENHQTAAPLMRPLAMEFPSDAQAATLTDEWLMGKGLLAAPLLNEGGQRTVYLPKDRWFRLGSSQTVEGPQTIQVTAKLDEIPVYVRAGTLLPLGPVRQWTAQPSQEPLELQIYPGRDGNFDLVEDGGDGSFDQADARWTCHFSWNERERNLSWKITGGYRASQLFQSVKAVVFSPDGRIEKSASLAKDGSVNFSKS